MKTTHPWGLVIALWTTAVIVFLYCLSHRQRQTTPPPAKPQVIHSLRNMDFTPPVQKRAERENEVIFL